MKLEIDLSKIPKNDIGPKLLENLHNLPNINLLQFPNWEGEYIASDFKFINRISTQTLNPVTKEFHEKAKVFFALKKVKVKWNKWMNPSEAKEFNQLIREIDTLLKVSSLLS